MVEETARRRPVRIAVGIAGLALFMYAVWSAYDHQAMMDWLRALRPLPYFAIIAILPAIGIPTTPLYILAGASFGAGVGLIGSWIALAINAALCFWISRWMRPLFERLLRRFDTELPDWSERERGRLRFALGVKLAPGAPASVKQYALGMSGISFGLYMAVTMLISGVYVAAFVVIGESLLDHRPSRIVSAVGVLAVLVVAVIWYRRRKKAGPGQRSTSSPAASAPA